MEEIWKDIPNYEGCYQASNLGRIRSLRKKGDFENSIMSPVKNYKGYLHLTFSKNGNLKTRGVHRWVISAFYGESNLTVNHINEIKDDNRLENLEYLSSRENVIYSQGKKIQSESLITGEIKKYNYINETKIDGFEPKLVSKVLVGKRKKHKEHIFKYL